MVSNRKWNNKLIVESAVVYLTVASSTASLISKVEICQARLKTFALLHNTLTEAFDDTSFSCDEVSFRLYHFAFSCNYSSFYGFDRSDNRSFDGSFCPDDVSDDVSTFALVWEILSIVINNDANMKLMKWKWFHLMKCLLRLLVVPIHRELLEVRNLALVVRRTPVIIIK